MAWVSSPSKRSFSTIPKNPVSQGSVLRAKFPFLTASGSELLISLLSLNPAKRPSAKEVLEHGFFKEDPKPKSREMFPTFPSKAGQEKRRRRGTPNAPVRGKVGRLERWILVAFLRGGRRRRGVGGLV
jgi:cell division cycle 2-like protein